MRLYKLIRTMSYVDYTPNAFYFAAITNAELSTYGYSTSQDITGINSPAPITTSGCSVSINGGSYVSSGVISNNQSLVVRVMSSGSYSTGVTGTVTIGGVSSSITVTTKAQVVADTTPDDFQFTPVTDASISNVYVSNSVTITGINSPASITTSGCQVSVDGSVFGTGHYISNGQTLTVRLTSSATYSTPVTGTVTIGGVARTFSVTTQANPVAYYLDRKNSNSSIISGNSLIGVTGGGIACASTLPIPKDGNWWYWEANSDYGVSNEPTFGTQSAAQVLTGVISLTTGVAQGTRGIAVRWYANKFYRVLITATGVISGTSTPTAVEIYAGVNCGSSTSSVTLLPYGWQHMFAPNIAASNAAAQYQAPCYPLLS